MKDLVYHPKALKTIQGFSKKVRTRIAGLLQMLCKGLQLAPKDFKYMKSVGDGVYELRIRASIQYRVFYVAKYKGEIYVLHAFVKKTQKTRQQDIEIGKTRYQQLLNEIENENG